jgi:hypothetical protein
VNVVVGAYGSSVAAAVSTPSTASANPGGETVSVQFDAIVDASGDPRYVHVRVNVTSNFYPTGTAYIRGVAVVVSSRYADNASAATSEVRVGSVGFT